MSENLQKDPGLPENGQEQIYLDQIKDLKEKLENEMISKEEYDKLLLDHKKLLSDYVNKRPPIVKDEKDKKTAKELSQYFTKENDMTNREYWKNALEYRDAYMAEYKRDPFDNPNSNNADPEKAAGVAATIRELLNQYPDDTEFRIKLNSVMKDDPMVLARIRKR